MKNDFGGHSNFHDNNVYAYVGIGFEICAQDAGFEDAFTDNQVFMTGTGNYGDGTCSGAGMTIVGNNSVYNPTGVVTECGDSLAAWQALGNDPGTTASVLPTDNDDLILGLARTVLGF
jgi:hypothetical protein